MKYYIYIVYSIKLDKYYVGSTQDLPVRYQEHLTHTKGFTGKAVDWEIKYSEEFSTR